MDPEAARAKAARSLPAASSCSGAWGALTAAAKMKKAFDVKRRKAEENLTRVGVVYAGKNFFPLFLAESQL